MAIWREEDFAGAPVGVTAPMDAYGFFDASTDAAVNAALSRVTYSDVSPIAGGRSLRFNGVGFSWRQILLGERNRIRYRAVIMRTGNPSTHFTVATLNTGGQNSPAAGTGADFQVRGVTGYPIHHRWNFTTPAGGATPNFPVNTWWRVEYEFIAPGHPTLTPGTRLEVWYDWQSTGEPDFSNFAASSAATTRLLIGPNATTGSGFDLYQALLAVSDGERIGPPALHDPASLTATVTGNNVLLQWPPAEMALQGYDIFIRSPRTGAPFDPEEDAPYDSISQTETSYLIENLALGEWEGQVFPVMQGGDD